MAFTSFVGTTKADGLIPVEYANQIISMLPEQSAALSLFTSVPMGTKTTVMPISTALPVAGFVGEGGAFSATTATWVGKNLIAEKVGCIVPIAREILEDTSFDIQADLLPKVVQAFGKAIDAAVFFGVGKPSAWTCNDILSGATAASNALITKSVTGQDLAGDLSDIMSLVEADGYTVNGFVCANGLKGSLRNLRDKNNAPIYQAITSASPALIYGENAYFSKNGGFDATKALSFAGDFTKGIIGMRSDIYMQILTEASITAGSDVISLAQNDMVGLKFVMRVGFQVADVVTATGTNQYPFAILKPAS